VLLTAVILFKLPFYSREFSDGIRVINLIPFGGSFSEDGDLLLREIIYNILLFVPLGVYVSMLGSKWTFAKKVLTIIGLSLSFEVIQLIFAMGRTDITDLIDNTLGGIIGVGVYALIFKIFGSKTVRIVNVLSLVITVVVGLRFCQLFYMSYFVAGQRR
jgi:glycopeptide antibiotics resistance protein